MGMNKFKVGELVLYKKGDTYELGIVKEILKSPGQNWKYRVWYHTGDTASTTGEELLFKLQNEYAFTIIRRTADTSNIETCPSRQMAAKLLRGFKFKTGSYNKLEDYFTAKLQGIEANFPDGIINSIEFNIVDEVNV